MSRLKNQTSFQKEGYKRVLCPNCGRVIGETHLGEKNTREIKCKECKNVQTIKPPKIEYKNKIKGVCWINDCCWTATPEL